MDKHRPAPPHRGTDTGAAGKVENDADAALFRAAMAGVHRRAPAAHVQHHRAPPSARPRSREADDKAVMEELLHGPFEADLADDTEALQYRGAGIQDRVWRKLRRGGFHVNDALDLHGLNREQAYIEVAQFVSGCHQRDARCIRIIHGKGLRSNGNGPVLRRLLGGWLRRRNDVLAFCPAQPCDGGSGASYVLLRAAPRERG